MSFRDAIAGAERFAAVLESLRREPLGCMRVDDVELVTSDWTKSNNAVERVAGIALPTRASRQST